MMNNLPLSIFIMPFIALSIDIILYTLVLKKTPDKHNYKKFTLTVFVLAFFMNYAWELLQGPLYEGYSYNAKMISFCALASVADAIMVLLLYFSFAVIYKKTFWIGHLSFIKISFLLIVGGIGAVLTEIRHTSEGNWTYDESMPIIPFVSVGLSPVLQFMLLPVLIYSISFYLLKRPR